MEKCDLVTTNGLAAQLKLSRSWLDAEIKAGRIPYLRAGNKKLFSVARVRQLLAERAAKGETNE